MPRTSSPNRSRGGLQLTDAEIRDAFSDPQWEERFPPILTIKQAADLAQVPVATIYDWRSRGRLNGCSRRVGRHVRIHRDRYLAFIFSSEN